MKTSYKLRQITQISFLLALVLVGSMVKLTGSIALDSLAAFVGAALLGPLAGFGLGSAGHLLTAAFAGFPLGLPAHLITGGMMGICLFVYGWLGECEELPRRIRQATAVIAAYLINVPLALFCLSPLLGWGCWLLFLPLSLGFGVNILLAELLLSFFKRRGIDL